MDTLEFNCRSGSDQSRTTLHLSIGKRVMTRLDEISLIENIPKSIMMEKLIMSYTPIPAVLVPGEFKSIYISNIQRLKRIRPYAITVCVHGNNLLGFNYKEYLKMRKELTPVDFQKKYIERLMLPDAQTEIARLRIFQETHDVFITSFERDEEGSMRKIFVDFVNGKIAWK